MPVAELQERMSSREFTEWQAFYQLEPFGFKADMVGDAQTAAVIANVNRGEDTKPYTTESFLPRDPEPPRMQTVTQMMQFAKMTTMALGGTIGEDDE